ncbi:MAG: GntR family transcriptional regulator [Eubacterium sp.]|jgi:DNA-binding GntR family transcriptional regulator|uniref:GntR family transcriptional regulator n=1 Tax=Eubacterium sp. F2 TaxID=3381348 RepID=UPI003907FC9B|nr:GntR family transcriptional regulator [Eubacterium sp.]MCI2197524.1 GntR family transcriptional regulator [Eubacterium sp.]
MSVQQYLEGKKDSNQPLSNNLYAKLQEDILTGRIKAGGKLTEQHICEKYRASRTPVREAIRQLEAEGLVQLIPNRGAFVIGLTERDISDILMMRSSMEVQAADWAAERISDKELDQLTEIYEYMVFYTHKGDIEKMRSINAAFHKIIYQSSHNRILQRQLNMFQTYLKFAAPDQYTLESLNDILLEHRAIYSAIMTHDPAASSLAMRNHLQLGAERNHAASPAHEQAESGASVSGSVEQR